MVKVMENPMNKWDDLGGFPPIFGSTPKCKSMDPVCNLRLGEGVPSPWIRFHGTRIGEWQTSKPRTFLGKMTDFPYPIGSMGLVYLATV